MSYSAKVINHFLNPQHLGIWTPAEQSAAPVGEKIIQAEAGSAARSMALRLALKIRVADEQILDARFQNIGIEMPIAGASCFCSIIIGKTLSEAAKITTEDLDRELEGLPEIQNRQPVLVLQAFGLATQSLRQSQVPTVCVVASTPPVETKVCTTPKEQPLCYCYHIPASALEKKIRQLGLKTVDEVTQATRAGAGCHGCHPEIEDLLKKVWSLVQSAWPAMTHAERRARIETVLENDLRPMIRKDGGDIQLLELDGDIVRITLHGNCVNCHSSTSTLKLGVERRLREVVWPTLEVYSVDV